MQVVLRYEDDAHIIMRDHCGGLSNLLLQEVTESVYHLESG